MSPIKKIDALGLENVKYPNIEKISFEPREFTSKDVDIKVHCCSICGADIHWSREDWFPFHKPLIPGHEIVGTVVALGNDVQHLKIGDRVGVGAGAGSCHGCTRCQNGHENNCSKGIMTYGNADPSINQQGGYATHVRVDSKFAIKIPVELSDEHAAPLMCGGITGFAPLLLNKVGKGSNIGVCGIGGIGHMSLLFGKALGANMSAISSSNSKRELVKELGIDNYIDLSAKDAVSNNHDSFELIIHTGAFLNDELLQNLLLMLKPNGRLQIITGPEPGKDIKLPQWLLIQNNISIGGSAVGSPADIEYMLNVAAKNNIKPLIEKVPINPENITEAWKRIDESKVRFRVVLTDYNEYFK
ncbi:hypothetical protein DAMA08_040230 [Martiniozyma asiatica (nom. inval.)]|nr:hypothetical protein DAMA08_040230 [Martiniozyma asiatica]